MPYTTYMVVYVCIHMHYTSIVNLVVYIHVIYICIGGSSISGGRTRGLNAS